MFRGALKSGALPLFAGRVGFEIRLLLSRRGEVISLVGDLRPEIIALLPGSMLYEKLWWPRMLNTGFKRHFLFNIFEP